jgi:hypothetical protein
MIWTKPRADQPEMELILLRRQHCKTTAVFSSVETNESAAFNWARAIFGVFFASPD